MSSTAIPRVQSQDRAINQLQQNIILGVQQLKDQVNSGITGGIFITAALSAGNNVINHNLQSVPTGFIITDINAAATVYRVEYTKFTVTLNSSAGATVTFYLF